MDEAIAAFRKSIELDPKYGNAHVGLGNVLCKLGKFDEARAAFQQAYPDPGLAQAFFAHALRRAGRMDESVAAAREAIRLDSNSGWAYQNLGWACLGQGNWEGAIAAYREAIRLKTDDAVLRSELGHSLKGKGLLDQAIAEYRNAIALDPKFAAAHDHLGWMLRLQGKLDDAVTACRKAVDLQPRDANYRNSLGFALMDQGKLTDAIAEYRAAIDIDPNLAFLHHNLGNALRANGNLDGALAEYRKAIDIDPKDAGARGNLVLALLAKGDVLKARKDVDGAIAECRKAIDIDPRHAGAHNNLGVALVAKKDMDGAIAEWRKAIELDPKGAAAHNNLGVALVQRGEFAEARQATVQCMTLLPANHPWHQGIQGRLKQCDSLLALDRKLAAFLDDGPPPPAIKEQMALADLCVRYKHYHATAARLYAGAFTTQPKLADDLAGAHRYNAACSALLAAAAKRRDEAGPDSAAKAKLRTQALDWLRDDLVLSNKQFQAGHTPSMVLLLERLPLWQTDPDLASVRDAKGLAVLSEQEQESWRKLWAGADALLKQVRASVTETTLKGTLTDQQREQVHELKIQTGKTYVIEMRSKELDSYLKLRDAAGALVAENDDIVPSVNLDARVIFTAAEDGLYRIVATSFEHQGRGGYTLSIHTISGKAK